jgi:hypothetical protein
VEEATAAVVRYNSSLSWPESRKVSQQVPKITQPIPVSVCVEVAVAPPPLIPIDQPVQSAAVAEPAPARTLIGMVARNKCRMKTPQHSSMNLHNIRA